MNPHPLPDRDIRLSPSMVRILIIEDSPAVCRVTARILQKHGFVVDSAASGKEGFAKAQYLRPQLILLDLNLPDISGFLVLRLLQADEFLRHIPVLFVTGVGDSADLIKDAATVLKAAGFLRKPWTPEGLLAQVRQALRSHSLPHSHAQPRAHDVAPCTNKGSGLLLRGSIRIDMLERKAWVGEKLLPQLPEKRFFLLFELMRQKGPVPADRLLQEIWPGKSNKNLVQVTVLRLRQDLKAFSDISIEATLNGYALIC